MSITLTTPESRPSSTQARLIGMTINVPGRVAQFEIVVGRVVAGNFVVDRLLTQVFIDDSEVQTFTALVNAVPQFAQLRQAMEQYFVNQGILSGTVS